jgi:hypothetical protein
MKAKRFWVLASIFVTSLGLLVGLAQWGETSTSASHSFVVKEAGNKPKYVPDHIFVRFKEKTPQGVIMSLNARLRVKMLKRFILVKNLYLVKIPSNTSVEELSLITTITLKSFMLNLFIKFVFCKIILMTLIFLINGHFIIQVNLVEMKMLT